LGLGAWIAVHRVASTEAVAAEDLSSNPVQLQQQQQQHQGLRPQLQVAAAAAVLQGQVQAG
jgi:hypothetical protein